MTKDDKPNNVIQIAAWREKNRKAAPQISALALLMSGASYAKPEPDDLAGEANHKRGWMDAIHGKKYRAPSPDVKSAYAYGYLEGVFWMTFRLRTNRHALFDALGYDGGRTKLAAHRPRRASKRVRDVTVRLEMWVRSERNPQVALEEIIADLSLKYGIGERTVWSIWGDDSAVFLDAWAVFDKK